MLAAVLLSLCLAPAASRVGAPPSAPQVTRAVRAATAAHSSLRLPTHHLPSESSQFATHHSLSRPLLALPLTQRRVLRTATAEAISSLPSEPAAGVPSAETGPVAVKGVVDVKAFKTPKEILVALAGSAKARAKMSMRDLVISGFLAGSYVAIGGCIMTMIGSGLTGFTALGLAGLAKLLAAAVFPIGLIMIVLTGSDLWTGNCVIMASGALQGTCTWREVFRNWVISFGANFLGALAVAYFLMFESGMVSLDPARSWVINAAEAKMGLTFKETFLRAIGANWIVNIAVMLVTTATTVPGKILAAWFPIMTFAAIGWEHSVANMFSIPLANMLQASSFTNFLELFAGFLKTNLLPVTLGNLVGGIAMVALAYDRIVMKPKRYDEPMRA